MRRPTKLGALDIFVAFGMLWKPAAPRRLRFGKSKMRSFVSFARTHRADISKPLRLFEMRFTKRGPVRDDDN